MRMCNKARKKLQLYEIQQNTVILWKQTIQGSTKEKGLVSPASREEEERTHAAFIRFHDMKVDSVCLVFKKSALSTGASLLSDSSLSFPLSQWKSCCSFQMPRPVKISQQIQGFHQKEILRHSRHKCMSLPTSEIMTILLLSCSSCSSSMPGPTVAG